MHETDWISRRRLVVFLTGLGMAASLVLAGQAKAQEASAPQESASAEESWDRWTPALSMKYRQVSGTALSPDGARVAYVVREPVMEDEESEYLSQVWLARTDGGEARQYTRGEASATSPRFSPDGQLLSFTSRRSGSNQIWLMPLSGGEAWPLTETENGVGQYRWAPDGSQIAFTMVDPETEEEKQAKKEKRDVILVDQNFKFSHLYVVDVSHHTSEAVEASRVTEGDFQVTDFDWIPSGEAIAFTHQPDPRINTGRVASDLSLVVLAEGNPLRHLVTTAGLEGSPRVSPDGAWIAYVSSGDQAEPVGLGDIFVIPSDGGAPRALAHTPDRSPQLVGWSRDGTGLYFSEAIGTTRQVLFLPVDGGEPRAISDVSGVLGSPSFARNADQMAFTLQHSDTPADVFVTSIESFEVRRISDLHSDVPRPAMGRTELLSWTAPDGTPVEGLLTYPVGYESGRVPVVLNVHGGPAGVYSQSFTGNPGIYMIQTFAQEGYAVLRPNPRGSTGYGKEFRYANIMDWGYGDFDDLMSGVDRVIEMGVGDPNDLYLMGWSYGGYMTSFAVTKTDRFKAASMGAGLPNLISMTTTTDIGDYLVSHMGGEFWDDYETYEKHSAMYHIKNVVTPTQVIHGAEDLRVPFTQGQEFYRALDRRGVPTEMIVYPRTPHGPREPKFLMDVSDRILAWFKQHEAARPRADG